MGGKASPGRGSGASIARLTILLDELSAGLPDWLEVERFALRLFAKLVLGAGTILKRDGEQAIEGLTTAAGIWMTSAVGVGRLGLALPSMALTWLVLKAVRLWEQRHPKSLAG